MEAIGEDFTGTKSVFFLRGGTAVLNLRVGSVIVFCGWCSYGLAMLCPAIDFGMMGLDSYRRESWIGAQCFWETMNPMHLMILPGLAIFPFLNLAMLVTPFCLLAPANDRGMASPLLLMGFLIALASPWLIEEVKGVRVGWWLWAFSYLIVGIGLLAAGEWPKTTLRSVLSKN